MTITDLPGDIFLLILNYLEIYEVKRCQFVSQQWREAFSQELCLQETLKPYSGTKEIQVQSCLSTSAIFDRVAARYFHLTNGRARRIEHHRLRALDQSNNWFPVPQWDYHESQPGGRLYYENAAAHLRASATKPYLFRPTLWTYDEGMVVLCPAETADLCFRVVELEHNRSCTVPFKLDGRKIRNLRLKDATLIIEWAEMQPYHDLNMLERVHRHFATCFDVSLTSDHVVVSFRSEWRIHFLGMPLANRDYFFSTHNKNHYCWYLWQPNRNLWTWDDGEDTPVEALFVLDISAPCPYKPSEDPANLHRPKPEADGPFMVARFSFQGLDYFGIRQSTNIAFLSFQIDSEAGSVIFRENRFESGQGYFDPAERLWRSTSTTLLFAAQGPSLVRQYPEKLPAYRGHCSMESAPIDHVENWFLPIMDVYDASADVRFSLVETCWTGGKKNEIMLRIKALGKWVNLDTETVQELGAMGRIAGDERWIIGQNASLDLVVARFQ